MDYKKLVEKYWNGATTIAEEQALKAYFNSGRVDKELAEYTPVFQYLSHAKKETITTPVVDLIRVENKEEKALKIRSSLFYISRIAATILFLVGITFTYSYFNQPTKAERLAKYWAAKEIKDPQLAYKKTKAALLLASKKLNNGTAAALNQVRKVQQSRVEFIRTKK